MVRNRIGGTTRRFGSYKIWSALIAAFLVQGLAPTIAQAKTPGKTYCFNGICHRVNTIPEMVSLVGRNLKLNTSFYDDCKRDRFNPCGLTSSGEVFRPNEADNAASPIYPNGTVLLLRNPSNGSSAVVRVNNAGPYWRKRKLDVSRATADKLGFKKRGVADLEVRVVAAPTVAEARYKKNRRYAKVAGPIGQYASIDQAQGGMMVAMALDAMSGSVFASAASKMLPSLKSASPELAKTLRSSTTVLAANLPTPADGLKAAARRLYGPDRSPDNRNIKFEAQSTMTAEAEIAPIHRARRRNPI
jgi:rare lipoprotein A